MIVRSRAELVVAVWGAATFGALLASYSAFRPVRDALVLDGDPEQIPWVFSATFLVVVIVSPLWSALQSRIERRRLVPLSFHAFALCALGFAVLVGSGVSPIATGRAFYVWSGVFNFFVVSVFWSLLADLLGPTIAKRLYGPIAAGGTIGAIVGPALTRVLVGTIEPSGVLVMSALLLELAVLGVHQVRFHGERLDRTDEHVEPQRPAEPGAFRGIERVARSPYLLAICGYVFCTATAATFLYLEQAALAKAALPDRVARTELFATIDLWVSGVTFVVQTFLASPLLRRFGPGVVLCMLPLAQGIGISILAVAPSLTALIIIQSATRTATHGLTRPARELLFTVVSRDDKYRAKNAIDTIVYRFGDFGSAWLHRGLVAFGAGPITLVAATVPLVVVWLGLAGALGAGFRTRLAGLQPKEPP